MVGHSPGKMSGCWLQTSRSRKITLASPVILWTAMITGAQSFIKVESKSIDAEGYLDNFIGDLPGIQLRVQNAGALHPIQGGFTLLW